MNYNQAREMLIRCKSEIQLLRKQIDELAPKAEAYDSIRQILQLMPQRGGGMGEDVVWIIDKELKTINDGIKADAAAKNQQIKD